MPYFFDWLSIKQTHNLPIGETLPIICKVHSSHLDTDTGEAFETRSRGVYEGSYSTTLSIRCDGHTVEVSGNPSRINRLDNLFGLSDLRDCVMIYNRILDSYGLPPFTPAFFTQAPLRWSDPNETAIPAPISSDHVRIDGAIIQEIHVTRNYCVGKGNEHKFYRAMGSFKHRQREPRLYKDGITWGEGSRRLYFGFYSKGAEFDLPRVKSRLGKLLAEGKINKSEYDYYDKVKKFAIESGIVRLEYKLKNNWLRDSELRFYNPKLTAQAIADDKLNIAEKWIKSMSISNINYDNIYDQLVDTGICGERAARVTESVFIRWLHGMELGLGRSQFYAHKSRLLTLGIDISMPCDVTSLRVHVRTDEITLDDCFAPDWYKQAA